MTSRDLISVLSVPARQLLGLGRWLYRYRGWTPVPFVLALLIQGDPHPGALLAGGLLLVVGEAIRLWSVAHSGPETRRSEVTANHLATGGPYAIIRNPIYLGNLIMYTGTVVVAHVPLLPWLTITWLFFGIQYALIILVEERALEARFGSVYQAYRGRVPGYWPRVPERGDWDASQPGWTEALRSETSTWASAAVVVAAFAMKMLWGG